MGYVGGLNEVYLVGKVFPAYKAKEFELKKTSKGKSYVEINMAIPASIKAKTQEKGSVNYVKCIAYDSVAEFIANYFVPGNRAVVNAKLSTSMFLKRFTLVCTVERFIAIDSGKGLSNGEVVTHVPKNDPIMEEYMNSGNAIDPEDLPF